ncbi:MAG: hypothetical protein AB7K04_01245 [Pseudorhodoplanes sp.]
MRGKFRILASAFIVAATVATAGLLTGSAASAQAVASAPSHQRVAPSAKSGPQVYLLRGLMNIFSLGMDDLANKLNARGVRSEVYNHSSWMALSDEIAARYRSGDRTPIVLIGHSLGADAVMLMGAYLEKKNVPVALIVPFDGTASYPATKNVARVFNLTQREYARMTRGPGFRGELVNMDVSGPDIGHISIDKSARLHSLVIGRVLAVAGRGSRPASKPRAPSAPSTAAPTPAAPTTSHATAAGTGAAIP